MTNDDDVDRGPNGPTEPEGFRIERLSLRNFRGFREATVEFTGAVTVFIGGNGAGKSTVIEALRILLSWLPARIMSNTGRGDRVTQQAIHVGADLARITLGGSYRTLEAAHTWAGAWSVATARKGSGLGTRGAQDLEALRTVSHLFHIEVGEDPPGQLPLPVLAYYGVGRSVVDVPRRIRTRHNYTRLDAYEGALSDGSANFRRFFEWFREREDEELENQRRVHEEYVDRGLQASRTAIARLLPGLGCPYIRRRGNVMVLEKDGAELSVAQLSDGERTLLTLVADLARRLAMATEYTHLHHSPLEGYGCVLIDEVELHLHPAWQRKVVQRLTDTFPNVQFILTTHSPLVLTTVARKDIRVLQTIPREDSPYPDRELTLPAIQSEGVRMDEALQAIMDVDPTPDVPIREVADEYLEMVQVGEAETEDIDALEQRLRSHYGEGTAAFRELVNVRRLYQTRARIAAHRKG